MATFGRTNNASQSRRSFISTCPFPGYFFSYKVQPGITPIFALGPVEGANNLTCPTGRILRENGRKLYPGINSGVETNMIGVYDSISFLSGFIDPNTRVFTLYTQNSPQPEQSEVVGNKVAKTGNIVSLGNNSDNFISLTNAVDQPLSRYSALYDNNGPFVIEAGNDHAGKYATLYEDGTITSMNVRTNTNVSLTSDGNIVNTGSIHSANYIYSSSGIGYKNGETQTQQTNKSTSITLNAPTGLLITSNSIVLANAIVSFTFNNTYIMENDILVVVCTNNQNFHYSVQVGPCLSGSCTIYIKNVSSSPQSEALKLQFAIIKSAI